MTVDENIDTITRFQRLQSAAADLLMNIENITAQQVRDWADRVRDHLRPLPDSAIWIAKWNAIPLPGNRRSAAYKSLTVSQLVVAIQARNAFLSDIMQAVASPATIVGPAASLPKDPRKVFVVHGRNLQVRDSMIAFLRSIALQPMEWSQAVAATKKTNPYIGEILDKGIGDAQCVVVLFTPDELAHLKPQFLVTNDPNHERNPTGQSRPNVIFEAGMAMGRFPDRTVLVEVGEMRPFSDIGGIHLVRLDNRSTRRQELANRLTAAGCALDLSGTDWHTVGDFDLK